MNLTVDEGCPQQQCRALEQYSVVRKLQLVSWEWADGRAERWEWKDKRTGSQRSECHMGSRPLRKETASDMWLEQNGAEEMAQAARRLPHKRQDLSLISSTHVRQTAVTCDLSTGWAGTEGSQDLPTFWCTSINKFQIQWESLGTMSTSDLRHADTCGPAHTWTCAPHTHVKMCTHIRG